MDLSAFSRDVLELVVVFNLQTYLNLLLVKCLHRGATLTFRNSTSGAQEMTKWIKNKVGGHFLADFFHIRNTIFKTKNVIRPVFMYTEYNV